MGQPIVIAARARSADDGAVAEDALREDRHVRRQPEGQHADHERGEVGGDQGPVAEDPEREHRLGGPALDQHEQHAARPHRAANSVDAGPRVPGPALATLEQAEQRARCRRWPAGAAPSVVDAVARVRSTSSWNRRTSTNAASERRSAGSRRRSSARRSSRRRRRPGSDRPPRRWPRRWRCSPAPWRAPRGCRCRRRWSCPSAGRLRRRAPGRTRNTIRRGHAPGQTAHQGTGRGTARSRRASPACAR